MLSEYDKHLICYEISTTYVYVYSAWLRLVMSTNCLYQYIVRAPMRHR